MKLLSWKRCRVPGCINRHARKYLMCAAHWYQVPGELRTAVYRHFKAEQLEGVAPSPEYLAAAEAAFGSIHQKTNRAGSPSVQEVR